MSLIQTLSDVNNTFLSRRELTCDFAGLGGKLKTLEAVDMITKEFKLDGKIVIPMRLKTNVGMLNVTGTFYVYDDEALAKKHINSTIFSRLEKTKAKIAKLKNLKHLQRKQQLKHLQRKQQLKHLQRKQQLKHLRRKQNNACGKKRQ